MINGLNSVPNSALKKWQQVTQYTMYKNLINKARSAKLQNYLDKFPRRTMNEAHERIRGLIFASASVITTIKRMDGILKEAFFIWRDFMTKIRARKSCLRRLAIFVKNQQRESFRRRKEKLLLERAGDLTKGNKIRHVLETVAKCRLKVGFNKIMGDLRAKRFSQQIDELRYGKYRLLEDNTELGLHNKVLVDKLEKAHMHFQSLSLHLDQVRLGRMVRVISKMIELPMFEALIMVKYQIGVS